MEMRWMLPLVAVLLLAAGCSTTPNDPATENRASSSSETLSEGLLQAPADAVTRAKAHTELAAAYYGIGNMGVALQEANIAVAAEIGRAHV